MHAELSHIDSPLNYIESRKLVYVPEYYELIRTNKVFQDLKKTVDNGQNITVYDFDGIRTNSGKPSVKAVSLELLKEKNNDEKFPFGHGYVVASSLLGIEPSQYII